MGEIDASIPLQGRPVQMPPLDVRGMYATLGQLRMWAAQEDQMRQNMAIAGAAEAERQRGRAFQAQLLSQRLGQGQGAPLAALQGAQPVPLPAAGGPPFASSMHPDAQGNPPYPLTSGQTPQGQPLPEQPIPPAPAAGAPQGPPVPSQTPGAGVQPTGEMVGGVPVLKATPPGEGLHDIYNDVFNLRLAYGSAKEGDEVATNLTNIQKSRMEMAQSQAEFGGRVMQGISDQQGYDRALGLMAKAGIDTSGMPRTYTPLTVKQLQENALTVQQHAENEIKRSQVAVQQAQVDAENARIRLEQERLYAPQIPPGMLQPIITQYQGRGRPLQVTPLQVTPPGGQPTPGPTAGATAGAPQPVVSQAQFQAERGMNQAYLGHENVAGFQQGMVHYKNIMAALGMRNAAGDKAVMDNFAAMAGNRTNTQMGLLRAVQGMGNARDQIEAWFTSHFTGPGGTLPQNIRDQIGRAVTEFTRNQINAYVQVRDQYRDQARSATLRPNEVAPGILPNEGGKRLSQAEYDRLWEPGRLGNRTPGDVGVALLQNDYGFPRGAF